MFDYKEFGYQYMRVLQLKRWRHLLKLKDKESLYFGQTPILEYVRRHPGCKQKDIADSFVLSRAAVTKSIKRMEKNELVYREVNESDERQFKLFITEKGIQLTDEAREAMNQVDELSFMGFSDEEKELLNSLIQRMANNLETEYSRNKSPKELRDLIEDLEKKEEE